MRRLSKPVSPDERDRLRAAITRLPEWPNQSHAELVEVMLAWLCDQLDGLGREPSFQPQPLIRNHPLCKIVFDPSTAALSRKQPRKLEANLLTLLAARVYCGVTGEPPRRTSKYIRDRGCEQETGTFARFLTEIFDILQIKASAAGQVRKLAAELPADSITRRSDSIT
jgi:hypothetical protein